MPLYRALLALISLLVVACGAAPSAEVDGELKRWHPVTLTFDGPQASETGTPNPFRDYRLSVTFTHEATGTEVTVPGYFAADGNAAETSATSGTSWRTHFTPHETGTWSYTTSFRSGTDVALSLEPDAGAPTAFDGATGTFEVAATDKTGRDHRGKGMLRYVGERYLRFDDGTYFVKGGADSPENLLAYADFDSTYSLAEAGQQQSGEAPTSPLHRYEPHVADWNAGDPTWQDEKGKGLIGALNYLAGKGMNAFSFLTMNVEGDGKDVWPWIAPDARDRYDVSKLAQWNVVFTHADSLGLFLHFKTQETENDLLLDGGDLGPERRLYYRELVARFGYHHALNWNLGEENDIWDELDDPEQERLKAYTQYIHDLDPYDHPVVIHTYPNQREQVYGPLVGFDDFEGASIQLGDMNGGEANDAVSKWVGASQAAGRPWNVSVDEPGNANIGVSTDEEDDNYNQDAAREVLWATLAAGGDGVEWYFGYEEPHNDLNAEDWRSRDAVWDYTRHALDFFRSHLPFEEMHAQNGLTPDENDYVFAKPGAVYTVYLPEGGSAQLDLGTSSQAYTVRWYDPRSGGALQTGSVEQVTGPGMASLGTPPTSPEADWAVLVRPVQE